MNPINNKYSSLAAIGLTALLSLQNTGVSGNQCPPDSKKFGQNKGKPGRRSYLTAEQQEERKKKRKLKEKSKKRNRK